MKTKKGTMSLAFSIPACIILVIIIISFIVSNLPKSKSLICTKTEETEGVKTSTRVVTYFTKEDKLASSTMTIEVESEEGIPDSDIETIKTEYKDSYYFSEVKVERLSDNKISAELDLSEATTGTFGNNFKTVRNHLIENYQMSCNSH